MKRIGTSAVVGVVDNVLVELQDRGMLTGNLAYARDVFRLGATFGGLLLNQYARGNIAEIAEDMCVASLPLTMHSIREFVKKQFMYSKPIVLVPNSPSQSPAVVSPSYGSRPTAITSY
jgi:hypothetical protein